MTESPNCHFHDGHTGGIFADCGFCGHTQIVGSGHFGLTPIVCESCKKTMQEPTHKMVPHIILGMQGEDIHTHRLEEIN